MRKYLIVAARFNKKITDGLLQGALKAFHEAGVPKARIKIVRVPGSWEIPFGVRWFASEPPAAVVTLGAVIKHETTHDYWINHAIFPELQRLTEELMAPIALGIITCDSEKQAMARSRDNKDNRGYVAAKAAVEMAKLTERA